MTRLRGRSRFGAAKARACTSLQRAPNPDALELLSHTVHRPSQTTANPIPRNQLFQCWINKLARLWRAFLCATSKHYKVKPLSSKRLAAFLRGFRTVTKNSTAQNWHKTAQKCATGSALINQSMARQTHRVLCRNARAIAFHVLFPPTHSSIPKALERHQYSLQRMV